jgi:hypothetical protein
MRPAFMLQEGIAIGSHVPDGEHRAAWRWSCVIAIRFRRQVAGRDGGDMISSMSFGCKGKSKQAEAFAGGIPELHPRLHLPGQATLCS